MTAKEYLLQYKQAKKRIRVIECAIEELETSITSININLDGLPHGSDLSDKTGRLAAAMADKQDDLYWARRDAFRVMVEVSEAIAKVRDQEYAWLLTMRYINSYTWEKIAVEMDRTYQWVAGPLHGHALQAFEEIMDELPALDSN